MYAKGLPLTTLPAFKYAATRGNEEAAQAEDDGHLARNLAMGTAAALPFAGLIGSTGIDHRNTGGVYKNWEEFQKAIQPGDILLSGDSDFTNARAAISLATGSPRGYHVSVVDPAGGILDSTPGYGAGVRRTNVDAFSPGYNTFEHVQILRPKLTEAERDRFLDQMINRVQYGNDLEKQIKEQLAGHPSYTEAQIGDVAKHLRDPLYDNNHGIMSGVKNVFLPKLVPEDTVRATAESRRQARAAPNNSAENTARNMLADVAQRYGAALPEDLSSLEGGAFIKHVPECYRGVCSTVPAEALHEATGRAVVPGKHIHEMIPSDWLSSEHVTPVGRFHQPGSTSPSGHLVDLAGHHGPTLVRGLAGAGLAAGVYGVSNWLERRRKEERS